MGEAENGECTAYLPPKANSADENRGNAFKVVQRFTDDQPTDLEYVIALVPDPRHSRLTMLFDRAIDAIEDAAQDEEFTFDSSWLPWSVEGHSYSSREDDIESKNALEARENCPGILFFRQSLTPTDYPVTSDSYKKGLAVLVIGEQTTGGLNVHQWKSALKWLKDQGWPKDGQAVRVLGPTFSGTLPSLSRRLTDLQRDLNQPKEAGNRRPNLYIFSGTVGSCESVRWFQWQLRFDQRSRFAVFQENDELQLYRFLAYLKSRHELLDTVAVLSEDETAYGGSLETGSANTACSPWPGLYDEKETAPLLPVRLFYPRDISALRAAYQEQSIFSNGPSEGAEGKPGSRVELNEELQNEQNEEGDTPPSYSKQQTALSQEAELFAIVSFLRAHHSQYVVLRGSNPLDTLFLTRFLRKAYPEGRTVLLGSEILFSREVDNTAFRGNLALTNFPLLPRLQHWSRLKTTDESPLLSHGHRVFSGNFGEGTYLAARFLINREMVSPEPSGFLGVPEKSGSHIKFAQFNPTVLDYADPYWLHGQETPLQRLHANTWLTVLGRDGSWPVALLTDVNEQRQNCPDNLQSEPEEKNTVSPPSTQAEIQPCGYQYLQISMGMDPPMPWYFALAAAVLLFTWHTWQFREQDLFPPHAISIASRPRKDAGYKCLAGFSTAMVFSVFALLIAPFFCFWDVRSGNRLLMIWLLLPFVLAGLSAYLADSKVRRSMIYGEVAGGALLLALCWLIGPRNLAFYYRALHLSNGASPILPFLFLFFGFYAFAWQCLAGNALMGEGRPELPPKDYINWKYFRASSGMAEKIDAIAKTFYFPREVLWPPIVFTGLIIACFHLHSFVLSFEGSAYSISVNLSLFLGLVVTQTVIGRLFWTWQRLQRLLVQLSRTPLCRTFYAMKDISIRSLWSLSTQVPRTQYRFFAQQMDALERLSVCLPQSRYNTALLRSALQRMKSLGDEFSKSYLMNLTNTAQWQPVDVNGRNQQIRPPIAECAGVIIPEILIEAWQSELCSVDYLLNNANAPDGASAESDIETRKKKEKKRDEAAGAPPPMSRDPVVRAAEEFVCLLYISYIQNILARMRTMVMAASGLYVAAMLALAFYPFVPKPSIALWMLLVLLTMAVVVAIVYAGLERDQILSYITNADTSLGVEFWLKYAGFLAPPVLALLTARFPEIADSLVQWVQPGLDAMK